MSDYELIEYAQRYIDENKVTSRGGLQKADRGFHNALLKRQRKTGNDLMSLVFAKVERRERLEGIREVMKAMEDWGNYFI